MGPPAPALCSVVRRWVWALVGVAVAGCRDDEPAPGAAPSPVATDAAPRVDASTPDAEAAAAAPCPDVPSAAPIDHLTLAEVEFADLPGWADDHHAAAIPAFLKSCAKLAAKADGADVGFDGKSGKAKQWRAACAAAARVPDGDDAAAKAFFEREFKPYAATGDAGRVGKFTGYYVQELRGSRTRQGAFQYPMYRRPPDLIQVDLEDYLSDARGRHVWGRADAKGKLRPYPTRAEIRAGLFDGKGLELFWVDDRVDALFTHIEGSGKVVLEDGSVVWLEFDGKNGRQYRGVGKLLRELGEPPGTGTMQGIRKWFADHPDRFDEIVDQDEAYVFFKESRQPGAVGSQMTVLTGQRSLAVDRAFVAASTPIWVETRAPTAGQPGASPWRQLLIAQDTGGGIKGPIRGDIFWGDDATAADIAGRMGGEGSWWLLLPRRVKVN
jgi:membrane-bound lytic murein transglycosylase A